MTTNTGGVHVTSTGDQSNLEGYLRACASAGYPAGLVKPVKDIGAAKLAKEISAQTHVCWRNMVRWSGQDDQDNPPIYQTLTDAQIESIAARWMEEQYKTWRSPIDYLTPDSPKVYQFCDSFEVTNEPNPNTEHVTNFDKFYVYCMKHAEEQPERFKLALWSFSSGCPEQGQLELMRGSLTYAFEHGHYLAVHDGSVNSDRRLFRQAAEDGTAFRYRMFQQYFGFIPQVLITECYQPEGYYNPDWADWQWYLTELRRDGYVIGAAWFTVGDY